MERDVPTAYMVAENKDFNSRAHVERDGLDWFKNAVMENILTHALTWSATAINIFNFEQWCISTHALTWSATRLKILVCL